MANEHDQMEKDPPEPRAPVAPFGSGIGAQQRVLALQRSAGNAAVNRLLHPSNRVVTPSLPAALIQRVMANVQFATLDNRRVVGSVIVERGQGTSGGAHATAFVVFRDAVVHAVVGQEFLAAMAAMLSLCDSVKDLPGYRYPDLVEDGPRAKRETDLRLKQIKENPFYLDPATVEADNRAPMLQSLIRDYLLLRNEVPGTYVPASAKPSGAKGAGEKNERRGAQGMNTPFLGQPDPGGKLTKSYSDGMWETFDIDAVPKRGTGPAWRQRAALPIAQHIESWLQAYPLFRNPEFADKTEAIKRHFVRTVAGKFGQKPDALLTAVAAYLPGNGHGVKRLREPAKADKGGEPKRRRGSDSAGSRNRARGAQPTRGR